VKKSFEIEVAGVRVITERRIIEATDVGVWLSISRKISELAIALGEKPTRLSIRTDGECKAFFRDRDEGIIVGLDWTGWRAPPRNWTISEKRIIAATARVDVRTLDRFLSGKSVHALSHERISDAIAKRESLSAPVEEVVADLRRRIEDLEKKRP
jgi:hypothetical protein